MLDAMPEGDVIAHMDWSAKHCRIQQGEISITYDWDTVARVRETRALGAAAAVFTYSQYLDKPNRPTIDESKAFIADYVDIRGKPFTDQEVREIWACMIYTAAYSARCEHAIDHANPGHEARVRLSDLLAESVRLGVI